MVIAFSHETCSIIFLLAGMKLTPDHKLVSYKVDDQNEIVPPRRSRRRKTDSESNPSSTSDGTS